jgi:hypothetical protein
MKPGIFTLTKNEQRVVVLLIAVLLATAFLRYWRAVSSTAKPNQSGHIEATATPFGSPEDDVESEN